MTSSPEIPPCIRGALVLSSIAPDPERAGYVSLGVPTECAYAAGSVVCGHVAERSSAGINRLNGRLCLKLEVAYAEDSARLADRLHGLDPDSDSDDPDT